MKYLYKLPLLSDSSLLFEIWFIHLSEKITHFSILVFTDVKIVFDILFLLDIINKCYFLLLLTRLLHIITNRLGNVSFVNCFGCLQYIIYIWDWDRSFTLGEANKKIKPVSYVFVSLAYKVMNFTQPGFGHTFK